MTWLAQPRACFDVETTGPDPRTARIVSASWLLLSATGDIVEQRDWLIDPGMAIPAAAQAVHGISTEYVQEHGAPAAQGLSEILEVLRATFDAGTPVIAFNAPFDFTIVNYEGRRHGLPELDVEPVIDPFVLDKQVNRYRPGKRTLSTLSELYQVDLQAAHTAAADAIAAGKLAEILTRLNPTLDLPAAELHRLQKVWAAEQAANFQEYLRSKGSYRVIDVTWPAYS